MTESQKRNPSVNQKFFVIGVDIDSILIERAKELNNNENITFKCLDIMKENDSKVIIDSYLNLYNKNKFDITFSFSITMWIHLNYGDNGLNLFLQNIANISEIIVLEPQPWKCYKNAIRRMKRCNGETFTNFNKLKIRNNVLENISVIMENICACDKIYDTTETKWGRVISVYKHSYKKGS